MRSNIFGGLLLCCLVLSGCFVFPVVGRDEQRDPGKYGVFSPDAEKILEEYSLGVLPKKEKVADQSRYWYCYDCAFLGNPYVFVFLSTPYEEKVLREEYERVQALGAFQRSLAEGRVGLSLRGDFERNYSCYTDDRIDDGRSLLFELSIFDFERREVRYLFFYGQDSHQRKEEISTLLKEFEGRNFLAS